MLELLAYRLRTAVSTLPDAGGWLLTLLLFALFAVLTHLILRSTRLFEFSLTGLPSSRILPLALIAVVTPSLPEEVLYRVLLLPHPNEQVSLTVRLLWSGGALLVFVAAHPLLALTAWPWSRRIFYRGSFLAIVALLGTVCTLAYFATGSVWASVALHWATVVGWKLFYGGPDFNLGRPP